MSFGLLKLLGIISFRRSLEYHGNIGIISLILGIMGVIIGMVLLPNQLNDNEALVGFWSLGLLLAAFGIANLVCWFLIDRKKTKKSKNDE